MENGVNRFIEISAIEKKDQREKTVSRYEKKITRSIEWIEKNFQKINLEFLSMDLISIACALDYTNFRYSDDWKKNNPNLKKWFDQISEKEFMKASHPGVSFKYE
jgi:glutathione S-transferase